MEPNSSTGDLIAATEHRFKVEFTTREVAALRNVGDLADLVLSKAGKSAL